MPAASVEPVDRGCAGGADGPAPALSDRNRPPDEPGSFALFFCVAYPRNARPTAVIEFPARDGGRLIVVKVRLADE